MTKSAQKSTKPLRIAVTGGSGRIGSEVVRQLVARGHSVLSLDKRQASHDGAKFVFIDLTRRELVQPIFEQVDAVAHLGEIPNIGPAYTNEYVFYHNTTVGSTVLQVCADLKMPRVIYTSTAQVYGSWGSGMIAPHSIPFEETHPLRPQNAYAMSKWANEGYARMIAEKNGLSIAVFRFPWVLDWTFSGAVAQEQWTTYQNATGRCEGFSTYVYVTDLARAYVAALENPRPGLEAYHFSATDVFSAMPIRERTLKHLPDWPALPADWPAYKSPISTDKAKAHFGWTPTWTIREFYKNTFGHEPKF